MKRAATRAKSPKRSAAKPNGKTYRKTTRKPKLSLERPSKKGREAKRAATRFAQGQSRLVCDLPVGVHRALKIHVSQQGITMRHFLLNLLAAEGFRIP